MAPIRKGGGSGLTPNGFSEVRLGDGSVLWQESATIGSEIYPTQPFQTTGTDPYENVRPDPDVTNPVLTASDVTDESNPYFVADPFIYVPDADDSFTDWYMFFEVSFDNDALSTHISYATSSDEGITWNYQSIVLDNTTYGSFSYPYILRQGSYYYMLPNPVANDRQPLFRASASNFPTTWTEVKSWLTDVTHDFLDHSLFWHNNRWWYIIGTNDGSSAGGVRVYYGPDGVKVLENIDSWTAHPNNPVVSGRSSAARGAGRNYHLSDGSLIVWYQDTVQEYGDKVRAYEVTDLTTSAFTNTELSVSPILEESGSGWNSDRMHHYDPWWLDADGYWRAAVDGHDGTGWSIGIYRAGETTQALLHEWPIDEGTGTTLNDAVGTNDGTINDATWSGGTWIGNYALSLDGSNDYISFNTVPEIGTNSEYSIRGTFELQSIPSSGYVNLLHHQTSDSDRLAASYRADDGTFSIGMYDGSSFVGVREHSVSEDTRYRYVYNYDGAGNGELYLNTNTGALGSDVATQSGVTGFDIGRKLDGSNYINAYVDEPIIESAQLSSTEVQEDYDRQPWTASALNDYSETDPNNELTVTSSTAWEGRISDGANSTATLYDSNDLSTYGTVVYSFDFEVLSYAANAIGNIVWAADADTTLTNTSVAGVSIGAQDGVNGNLNFMSISGTGTSGQTSIATLNENTQYSAEITYDTSAGDFTVELFDSGGTSLGTNTDTTPAGMSHHYAFMGSDLSFGTPGTLDIDVSNVAFTEP